MKQLILAIIFIVLLALPSPAYADIAPPAQPPLPGADFSP